MTVLTRFSEFYSRLDLSDLHLLPQIYSADIQLIDPVGTHCGLEALTAYFEGLLTNNDACEFDILSISDPKHVRTSTVVHEQYMEVSVVWQMHFATPALNKGKRVTVDGMSLLHIRDERIFYHRDYYDMGQMVYEYLPVLSWLINTIKKRLRA
ncbi:MAG: nuclear transport factor 2 family protein [Glaciecola sp.]|jgi:limonene-1,2-epoxide hydrolase